MQPSKERESAESDPLEDLEDLLDDDLKSDEGGPEASRDEVDPRSSDGAASGHGGTGRVGLDGRWFSVKAFVVALVAVAVGVFAGGLIPLVGGTVGTAGGVFLAAFLLGLGFSARRYVETGVAGAAAGAVTAVTSVLGVGFLPIGLDYLGQWGVPLLAVGGGLGLVLAVLGHYFGRDLRAGLTEDIGG